MYLHPGNSIRLWQVSLALAFLLAVTAFVVFYWRRGYLAVGWLWFLGTMVPMVGLMQVGRQAMADRYAYLPLVGLFIMFCWGLADLAKARRLPAALLPTASVVVLAILAVLTYRQVGYWANDLTIWNHTAQVTEGNWFAESCVGDTLRNTGRSEEAVPHYLNVLKSDPSNTDANLGVALYLHESGHYRESIPYYNKYLEKAGDDDRLHQVLINLGYVYRRLGDNEHSKEYFDKAEKVPAINMRSLFDR
jgi:tetratricopeptide (TPR) repeat protein